MHRRPFNLMRDYTRVLAVQRVSWPINFPGSHFSESAFRSALAKGQSRDGIYVYEKAGELVGWLWIEYSAAGAAHIRQLQVQQAHWGRGLGRQILNDALALSAARGCHAITLNVTKSNARAMALYEHCGFVMTRDDGARQRMRLELTDPLEDADTGQ